MSDCKHFFSALKRPHSFLVCVFCLFLTGLLVAATSSEEHATTENQPTCVCEDICEQKIASLFERWNDSLLTGDPAKVVANYAKDSILLPTLSNIPRLSVAEKEDYFAHFLEDGPSGKINMRKIEIGCNIAVDTGLYTFTFAKTGEETKGRYTFVYAWDGTDWLIISHHSSLMPE